MMYLTVAYTIIWLVIAVFVLTSGKKLSRLEKEMNRLDGLVKRQVGRE